MNLFRRIYYRHILRRYAIKHDLWAKITAEMQLLKGLSALERTRLRELSTVFLHQKQMTGVRIQITDDIRVTIAAQACLPILDLGIGFLDGWADVIVYPDAFYVNRDVKDEFGVVHQTDSVLSGEAWSKGPLIVSWEAIQQDLQSGQQGHNVIIHEIAHKLDMLNGWADGVPPLHLDMKGPQWTEALRSAYHHLLQRIEHHHRVCINPYAASNPAEFFAVISEYFFAAPTILNTRFPDVYKQLQLYYRQDPVSRQRVADDGGENHKK